ncbi:thioredoxin domain-containing protein 3-like [Atheta coriaria]|uniref:thioredoxin domain-containing protein 3-like n=1 Tax=Dalotia coriaria TaxID=877792 RepID=UPI0031F477A0
MAKAKQVQLQIDITSDEEWEKFLQRDGLLVVDIYSEWCGPCLAMQGNLKKIKLESGGDFLHLGMARSNNVEALKRFRNKSEPTWMFIAKGQQVGLLFGSNAPELQRMIMDEMVKEKECLEGIRTRPQRLPEENSEQEQATFEKHAKIEQDRERVKVEKAQRQLKDRRIAQAKNILDTMAHLGLIIIFPHAVKKSSDILDEFLPHTGIAISKKERPQLTEEAIEDIEFLSPDKMPEACKHHLCSERALALMLTVDQEMNPGPLDETILKFAYGATKIAPGEPGTPAYSLLKSQVTKKIQEEAEAIKQQQMQAMLELDEGIDQLEEEEVEVEEEAEEEEAEEEQVAEVIDPNEFRRVSSTFSPTAITIEIEDLVEEEVVEEEVDEADLWGLWAPANDLVKSTALKYCFPLITSALILPEPEPAPAHLAIAFEVFKKHDIYKVMDEYESEILAFGFFTSDQPDEAKLIAKTKKQYEKHFTGTNYGEKLVLKVAKRKSDPILAFAQLGPTYMSSNVDTGERDCSHFFPENYEDEDAEIAPLQPRHTTFIEDTIGEDQEEMIFEGVLHGEEEEDLGDLGGEVKTYLQWKMSELISVEDEEEGEEGEGQDKATTPTTINEQAK